MATDSEIQILSLINEHPDNISQRDLAQAADLSLGMTNAVLKKLVSKGLLVMKRINSRNIQYALTPQGISEIARRSQRLLKRTLQNVAAYRDKMEVLAISLKEQGYTSVYLKEKSDLDFILEWACMKNGMEFSKKANMKNQFSIKNKDLAELLIKNTVRL